MQGSRKIEALVEELDVKSNRVSFSLIISALIVGSSIIITTGMSPRLFGVSLLGIFGFFIAGVLGMGLICQDFNIISYVHKIRLERL